MKAWVIPNSEPSLTNFTNAELRILNNRGYEFRDKYQPGHVDGNQNSSNTTVEVASRTVSCPYPTKPFVKLPPQDGKSDQPPDLGDSGPRESPSIEISQPDLAPPRKELPGKRWTEKWKEVNGIQGATTDESTDENEEKKSQSSLPAENKREPRLVCRQKSPDPKGLSVKGQMQYKVSIPHPSLKQMHMFRPVSSRPGNMRHQSHNTHPGGPPIKNVYQAHPSTFNLTSISQPHRSYKKTSTQPGPNIVTSIPRIPAEENDRETKKLVDADRCGPSKSMVEILWESLAPENHASSQTAEDISIPQISNPPRFPFRQQTDSEVFPFQPVLNQRPAIQIIENAKSNSSDNVLTTNSCKEKVASQVLIDDSPTTQVSLVKSTVCYEWNYFLACSTTENGECQKVHVCEICGSSEHRATQHWHHLATAPLPEIQMQPKLSTFAPPPESPTLSALREHTSRFMNRSINMTSQQAITSTSRFPRISQFSPPLGLEGSHRIAAQAERLKLRKRLARPKLAQSTEDTVTAIDTPNVSNKNISPALPTPEISVTAQTSPFERPVEVILPPPLRPFQRKSTQTDTTTACDDPIPTSPSPGGLRVTAPAFEPSYAGAWVPFTGTSNQFSGLFKIPSKESRRIQIVAPVDKTKGKDVAKEEMIELPIAESQEMRSESRHSIKSGRSKGNTKSTENKLQSIKTELWPAFSVFPRNDGRSHSDLPETDTEWDTPDFSQPSTSKNIEEYSRSAHGISPSSKKLDRSVLQILDEQLEAIMGQESEETIATTLETIIEICSASSVVTTPRRAQFESSHTTDSLDFGDSSPNRLQDDLQNTTSPSQLASLTTNQYLTLEDFADDDFVFGSTSPRAKSYQIEDCIRPRSADSSSTAPLTPFGSPQTPKILDLDHPRSTPMDHIPLKGRVEKMMSCAAASGAGQCNCGLGDWFHHVTPW